MRVTTEDLGTKQSPGLTKAEGQWRNETLLEVGEILRGLIHGPCRHSKMSRGLHSLWPCFVDA